MTHEELEILVKATSNLAGETSARLDRSINTYNDNFHASYEAMKRLDNAITNVRTGMDIMSLVQAGTIIGGLIYINRDRIKKFLGFDKKEDVEEEEDDIDEIIDDSI
jgi:hypothetical protein